ncbi:MAG TPA: hypothetical protein VNZ47_02470 [Candidatus Dormibacteraeota bacterium]|jgi:hypothetical protein|nr:hypothetical protein [Candidatus Dormibacteraeota bacterium]
MSQQTNRNKDFWDEVQFELLVVFGWLALGGLLLLALAFVAGKERGGAGLAVTGTLLVLPAVFHATLITVWHWKSRYQGFNSKLWGALLMLENTGWSKLIYFFRHVLPDRRNRGRYARLETPQG